MNKYIDLRIIGNDDSLKEFVQLCAKIQFCCNIGTCGKIKLVVDGDGSANLKFELKGEKISSIDFERKHNPKLIDNEHWIGE